METPSLQKASEKLIDHKQEVVEAWLDSVREKIYMAAKTDRHRMIDNLPHFIEDLAHTLQTANSQKTLAPSQAWKEHAIQRARQTELTLTDIIQEYHVLRAIILEILWQYGPLKETELQVINKSIDDAISKSVAVFEAERMQTKSRDQILASIFLKSIPTPFFILDDTWTYIYVNEAAAQQSPQRKKTELIGKRFWDIHPEALGTQIQVKLQFAMQNRKAVEFEFHYPPSDQWFLVECYPNEIGIAVYYREINAQKEAERKIEEQKTLLEAVIHNMPAGVRIHDARTGKIIIGNNEVDRLTGGHIELGSWEDFIQVRAYHEDRTPFAFDEYPTIRALHGEIVKDEQLLYRLEDGTEYYLLCSAAPIKNDRGVITHVVAVVTEINELKKVEMQLAESNRDLSIYSATVAHDLKSPIGTIASMTEILALKNNEKFDRESEEMIRFIVSASQRMLRLIDNLLSYAKINEEEEPFRAVDLNRVLDDVQKNLKGPIEESHAEISSPFLPKVIGDEIQLVSLFQNLISNSIKFRGPLPPKIKIVIHEKHDCFQISVIDNGIGFDPYKAEHLFEPFHRLHGKTKFEGTGLGLAICKRIVERHHGRIWAHSNPECGTTFTFELPKHPPRT